MLEEVLYQIGFTSGESQVYLLLLQAGPLAGSSIARKTKLNRSSVYNVVKSLVDKGVISTVKRNNVQYFVASDPNSLIGFIDRKCRMYDYYRDRLVDTVPKFRNLSYFQLTNVRPDTAYFEGVNGLKFVLDEFFKSDFDKSLFINGGEWKRNGYFYYFDNLLNAHETDSTSLFRLITKADDECIFSHLESIIDVIYLSNSDFLSYYRGDLMVCSDKTSFFNVTPGNEFSILIKNEAITSFQLNSLNLILSTCGLDFPDL